MNDKRLEIATYDGPLLTVRDYSDDMTTVRFDWPVNQPWYLTLDEAQQLAHALLESVNRGQEVPY